MVSIRGPLSVADTSSTDAGGIYGWLFEVRGQAILRERATRNDVVLVLPLMVARCWPVMKILCMPHVHGLRSPYVKVGRLVYFGRMLDKIRLHAMGKLPPEYQTNLGDAQPKLNDGRCCRFLGIEYQALVARTLEGGTDEEILAWAHALHRRGVRYLESIHDKGWLAR